MTDEPKDAYRLGGLLYWLGCLPGPIGILFTYLFFKGREDLTPDQTAISAAMAFFCFL